MNKLKPLLLSLFATATMSAVFSPASEASPCAFSKYKSNGLLTNSNFNSGSVWTKILPIKPDYRMIAGFTLSTVGLLGLGSLYLKSHSQKAEAPTEATFMEHPEAPGGVLDVSSNPTLTDATSEKENVLI